jgi:LuxR family quorum sensing-dependent transcriptional regulator
MPGRTSTAALPNWKEYTNASMLAQDSRGEALSAIDRLNVAKTPDDVVHTLTAALKGFGAEFFCLGMLPQPGQKYEEVMLAHCVPTEWLRLYLERDFAASDPSIRHLRHTVHPFDYKDAPYDPEREPKAAEVVSQAADFQLSRGFLVPIPGPTGCEGGVWIGGYHFHLHSHEKPVVHLIALYAFDRVRALTSMIGTTKPCLTSRQREVLTWTAAGKTAWEIGEILHITKRTVDEHTHAATRKLGAANRTQAVAVAIRNRLISP